MPPGNYATTSEPPTSVAIDHLIRTVPPGKESAIDVADKLLEDGRTQRTLVITSRNVNPEPPVAPVKSPSPKRSHIVYDIEGFRDYLAKFGSENTVVFADPGNGEMTAIIDELAATGFEAIKFIPQIHPIFAPWNTALSVVGGIKIKDFVDFLANNRRAIVEPPGRELVFLLSQVRLSRKVEIHQGDRSTSVNGILVETSIQGKTENDFVEVPETIKVHSPIYLNTDIQHVEIDITLGGNEQTGVVVKLSAGDLIQKKSDLFDQMLVQLKNGLKEGITVTTGHPAHTDWKTLAG
jgi:hypothetical protein